MSGLFAKVADRTPPALGVSSAPPFTSAGLVSSLMFHAARSGVEGFVGSGVIQLMSSSRSRR